MIYYTGTNNPALTILHKATNRKLTDFEKMAIDERCEPANIHDPHLNGMFSIAQRARLLTFSQKNSAFRNKHE